MVRKITFCTYDAPLFHSVNTWLKRLLPELKKRNFSIRLLVFYEGNLDECETYKFFINHGFDTKTFPFLTVADEKIRWILETLSVDPPHIFVPNMLVHALFAGQWVKKAGIPTIGLIHSDDRFYDGLIDQFVNGKDEFRLSAVVACSQYLYNKVLTHNIGNVLLKCIPYGVPTENIPTKSADETTLKLIYTGRLVEEQKRISDVVKAMCFASNEIAGVHGVIYGNGDNKKVVDLIEQYSLNKQVRFGGSVANDDIFNVLSEADVFVLLSDYEGLSQSLLEAMACGLVPVCSDMKSGIPELIANNKTGIIVKDRRSDFVRAIKVLKDNPGLYKEISSNAKKKIIDYSLDTCCQLWIELLNELPIANDAKIEVPVNLSLPERHKYFKYEDFRPLSTFDHLKNRIRKTKIFKLIKNKLLHR